MLNRYWGDIPKGRSYNLTHTMFPYWPLLFGQIWWLGTVVLDNVWIAFCFVLQLLELFLKLCTVKFIYIVLSNFFLCYRSYLWPCQKEHRLQVSFSYRYYFVHVLSLFWVVWGHQCCFPFGIQYSWIIFCGLRETQREQMLYKPYPPHVFPLIFFWKRKQMTALVYETFSFKCPETIYEICPTSIVGENAPFQMEWLIKSLAAQRLVKNIF